MYVCKRFKDIWPHLLVTTSKIRYLYEICLVGNLKSGKCMVHKDGANPQPPWLTCLFRSVIFSDYVKKKKRRERDEESEKKNPKTKKKRIYI